MKTKLLLLCAAGLLVALTRASAATRYVDAASTNAVSPFTNWANAAAVIQDAVDVAAPGDEIVVTNGVYQTGARVVYGMSNRVAVTKPVTVRSVNGPAYTSIVGHGPIGENAVRCAYLTNGAALAGFTLTNGATQMNDDPWVSSISTSGGGLWCESQTAVVTNCVLTGNSAFAPGGGAYSGTLNHCALRGNSAIHGGGAAGSALNNCTLNGNLASSGWTASASGGGAAWSALANCTLVGNGADTGGGAYESTLDSCTLAGNSAGSAGGARSSTLTNCTITGNSVENGAGGVAVCTLNNCTLANNTAYGSSGGGAYASTLNNCIVTGNYAGGFGGGGAYSSTLNGCTLTSNSAETGGGATYSTLNNCIVYYNSNFDFDDYNYYGCAFTNSCTTPDPGGVGNITNAPLFVDTNGWSNLRLQSNSPCINAGNNAYVTTDTDLDGRPRVVGGTVDIGAYEWQGTIRYVSAASTNPITPYSSWASAAVTIQDAVDAAVAGDEIVVTNGVYQTGAREVYGMSNRVAVTKAVTVRSVNGPAYTSIVGQGPVGDSAIRCAYLTNGAVLAGFTLTNGATRDSDDRNTNQSGGGVWCEGRSAVLSNCTILDCSSFDSAGGTFGGTLNNCTLAGNTTFHRGGGAFDAALNNCVLTGNNATEGGNIPSENGGGGTYNSSLTNCTLYANQAEHGGGAFESTLITCTLTNNSAFYGGGAYSGTLRNCTLSGNWGEGGGGAYASTLNNCTLTNNGAWDGGWAAQCVLMNCTLTGNRLGDGGTGVGGGALGCSLINCTLTGNRGENGGGAYASALTNCTIKGNVSNSVWTDSNRGGGAAWSTLDNCTVVGNTAQGEFARGGGVYSSTVNNCIVYYNFGDNHSASSFEYSCTTPAPGNGIGNISTEPAFVDMANGNLRLQSNSPCINAGNNAYVTAATDLDSLPRIAGGTVDIGAYEFQSPASTISYAWLQQSGLPTDGSADDVDTDHDGHNNWQEWVAGTDPTNALSVLRLASPVITPTNVTLTWTSVTNRTYTLEQATNLGGVPAFSVLRSNLVGLPGTTSWTDTNAPVSSPRFYQLRVSP